MKQRLWFSLALIAVLFCFWLVLTKPMCRDGFAASLGNPLRMELRRRRELSSKKRA